MGGAGTAGGEGSQGQLQRLSDYILQRLTGSKVRCGAWDRERCGERLSRTEAVNGSEGKEATPVRRLGPAWELARVQCDVIIRFLLALLSPASWSERSSRHRLRGQRRELGENLGDSDSAFDPSCSLSPPLASARATSAMSKPYKKRIIQADSDESGSEEPQVRPACPPRLAAPSPSRVVPRSPSSWGRSTLPQAQEGALSGAYS